MAPTNNTNNTAEEATVTTSNRTGGRGRGGRSNGRGNSEGRGGTRSNRSQPPARVFKGDTPEMRGHVFETHQERGAAGHLANQYETTIEHLIEYVGQHLSEKHAGTVMVSILENMKEPIETMPLAPTDPMLQINQ